MTLAQFELEIRKLAQATAIFNIALQRGDLPLLLAPTLMLPLATRAPRCIELAESLTKQHLGGIVLSIPEPVSPYLLGHLVPANVPDDLSGLDKL